MHLLLMLQCHNPIQALKGINTCIDIGMPFMKEETIHTQSTIKCASLLWVPPVYLYSIILM